MTGSEIALIRSRLKLTPFAFATVLGVHMSSIYRWESSDSPKIDTLQREILIELFNKKMSPKQGADLGKAVNGALSSGGTLHALGVLLSFITKDD